MPQTNQKWPAELKAAVLNGDPVSHIEALHEDLQELANARGGTMDVPEWLTFEQCVNQTCDRMIRAIEQVRAGIY